MAELFDIFIGGPMGDLSDDGAGVPWNQHLTNIERALENIIADSADLSMNLNVQIHNPGEEEVGNITDRVFSMIDRAEIGIIDVSANSPSTMYELALLHALGTPVIPLQLKYKVGSGRLPFYLRHEYAAVVPDYSVDTLVNGLKSKVLSCMGHGSVTGNPASNPISRYYGLPLVDVSATTGLATGYFHNFVRHLIKETNSIFQRRGEVEELIVLRPKTLNEVSDMKAVLDRRIKPLGAKGLKIELLGEKDGSIYEDRDQVRGQMLLFKIGKYVVDFPAPLNAQKSSPRYKRILEHINTATGARKAELERLLVKFESAMVDQYFRVLGGLARQPDLNPTRLRFLSMDEFIAELSE